MCLLLIGIVVVVVLIVLATQSKPSEGFEYHGTYTHIPWGMYGTDLEYNDACRWDNARRCTRNDGTEGTCVLGGLCAPSFYPC